MSSRPGRSSIWPLAVGEVGRQARARRAVDRVRRLSSRGIGMAGFNCMYSHGFLRVASCVPRGRVADPVFAARAHLELAAAGHARHVGVMLFPELGLSAYAIDDLLLQDALLDAVEAPIGRARRGLARPLPGAGRRRAAAARRAALQYRRGDPPRPDPGRRRPRPTCPTTASSTRSATSRSGAGVRGSADRARRPARRRSAPTFCSGSSGSVAFTFHVEICEDFWAPLPPSTRAALAGRRGPAQPLGQQRHHRQGRHPAPALRQPVRPLRSPPMSIRPPARANRPPTSPGTARRRSIEHRRPAGRERALSAGCQR